jgi:CheY-like chemotaxis protein
LAITSELGKGTKVSLFLPVAECPAEKPVQQDEMPFGDGQLVLVVEDDAMVREATLKRLEALGYAVIEASDGAEALRLLADGEPVDLVFSDMVMPGEISGYDLLDTVRRHYPKVARLLTSGYASARSRPSKPDAPLPELLRKPYSMAVLARAIERALMFSQE